MTKKKFDYKYVLVTTNMKDEVLNIIGFKDLDTLIRLACSDTEEDHDITLQSFTKADAKKLGIIPTIICLGPKVGSS